jgi:hypothetical protein
MKKIFFIATLSLLGLFGMAQGSGLIAMLEDSPAIAVVHKTTDDANLLSTVIISLDKANNRIIFTTPHRIEGVSITVKQRNERVIIQQNNMTVNKDYSITFPSEAGINRYTIILQKNNQILVKRLEKDWM